LVTVATALLLLVQVPPDEGDKVVVPPTQIAEGPVMLVPATTFTVTGEEGFETHPVEVCVYVKVAEPASNAVTIPPLVIVATNILLEVHVPPVAGVKVVVPPTHKVLEPVMEVTGLAFIVIAAVGFDTQPVVVLVNVNVAVPPTIPVTTPALVTVATAVLLLTHVPPVAGDNVVVEPSQMVDAPVMLTVGLATTVIALVAFDTQPVAVLVKVKVAEPAAIPVTKPTFVTVAIAELLLTHVPPVVGDNVVVDPTQMDEAPVMLTVGFALTVTALVGFEAQPVDVLVKVNVALPAATPVTTPALVTVAIAVLLLTHVPPVVGESVVVVPTHIVVAPVMLTVGLAIMVTADVAFDTQPVVVLVNVKVAEPAATPVTTPALVTVATAVLLLTHVPPVAGESVVVEPIHTAEAPVMLTVGIGFTLTVILEVPVQPFESVMVTIYVVVEAGLTVFEVPVPKELFQL
jgi:hypothetical protein